MNMHTNVQQLCIMNLGKMFRSLVPREHDLVHFYAECNHNAQNTSMQNLNHSVCICQPIDSLVRMTNVECICIVLHMHIYVCVCVCVCVCVSQCLHPRIRTHITDTLTLANLFCQVPLTHLQKHKTNLVFMLVIMDIYRKTISNGSPCIEYQVLGGTKRLLKWMRDMTKLTFSKRFNNQSKVRDG